MYVKDNYDLFEEKELKDQEWLDKLPKCICCGEPVQQEMAVCINGDWYCDACLAEHRELILEY